MQSANKQSQGTTNVWSNIDGVPSHVQFSHQEALLYVFEDNEAVIKMIIKGRSPTMRHVSRTHRVALDLLFDKMNLDPKIQIKYIDTKNHLADILTKGNFTRDEWNHLLCLFDTGHFSSTECSEVMSKRTQKDSGEERVTAKSKPMMNSISRCSERTPDVLPSTASESPGKTRHESQSPLKPQTEKYDRTVRPVEDAYSSSYSEWNIDKTWSSQEWKSDELMEDRTGRPVVTAQHTDRFIGCRDWDWTGFPLSTCGIWLFLSLETQFRLLIDRGDPLSTITKCKAQTNNLKERPTCGVTLMVFPQTSSLHIRKLCCMCLKTTKQWSRWS